MTADPLLHDRDRQIRQPSRNGCTGSRRFSVLATLPIAWVMINMAHDNPWLQTLFLIHKSLGVTIFAVVALRILWRGLHPAPPLSWTLEPWEAWFARISHFLLYLLLLTMPISGYITSAASNHPVNYFGLVTLPSLPLNKPLADAAGEVHEIRPGSFTPSSACMFWAPPTTSS